MAKYVIVEESWEYNDEWHYQPESEGYNIKSKLYTEETLNEAQTEVDRLNEEVIQSNWFRKEPTGLFDDDGDELGDYIRPYKIVKIEE
jgi:hypothetical protein